MKRRDLVDFLAKHADALNQDHVAEDWLANDLSSTAVPSFITLLQIAQAVKQVLVPVTPSPLFQTELKRELAHWDGQSGAKRPFPKTIWVGAAVSVIGLSFYLLRRFRPAGGGAVTAV